MCMLSELNNDVCDLTDNICLSVIWQITSADMVYTTRQTVKYHKDAMLQSALIMAPHVQTNIVLTADLYPHRMSDGI